MDPPTRSGYADAGRTAPHSHANAVPILALCVIGSDPVGWFMRETIATARGEASQEGDERAGVYAGLCEPQASELLIHG
ncbi:hypothetical protein JCM9534A_27050 [Catenuloplanes indicus JCM 9534]|uniref:Uncharacterized protein n=1 Tax=Catenuloplanes indicus TaxID=137267 RepID=A0AAE4AXC9_9ACTN|nr:hypothetical protein [Catenuloplanes indicus]